MSSEVLVQLHTVNTEVYYLEIRRSDLKGRKPNYEKCVTIFSQNKTIIMSKQLNLALHLQQLLGTANILKDRIERQKNLKTNRKNPVMIY